MWHCVWLADYWTRFHGYLCPAGNNYRTLRPLDVPLCTMSNPSAYQLMEAVPLLMCNCYGSQLPAQLSLFKYGRQEWGENQGVSNELTQSAKKSKCNLGLIQKVKKWMLVCSTVTIIQARLFRYIYVQSTFHISPCEFKFWVLNFGSVYYILHE